MDGVERPERVPGLLVPHLLAIGVMVWQAWFVRQPIDGDMAFWSPAAATFLAAAIWLVAGGSFAFVRWGMVRPLMLADVAALPAVVFGSLGFLIFFGGIAIAILLLVGLAMTWRARRRTRGATTPLPRPTGWPSLALLAAPIVVWWWYGLSVAYDFIGHITDYGLPEVMIGGLAGAAVVLWLDRRPGLLLASGACLVYFGANDVANGLVLGFRDPVVEGAILLASGLFAVILAGRDLRPRRGTDLLIPLAIALGSAAVVLVEPLLVPFVVVAAVAFERTLDTEVEPVTAVPATP